MHRENRWFASAVVSVALMAPVGLSAIPRPQDDRDHERHEQEEHQGRMYDPQYRDYHNWNDQEDRYYREWLGDRHREFVAYDRLDAREQREYWKWRHKQEKRDRHEEHEEHEHEHPQR